MLWASKTKWDFAPDGGNDPRLVVTLDKVFREQNVPEVIDLFSLGLPKDEAEKTMSGFPWSRHKVRVLAVELPSQALSNILRSNDYTLRGTEPGGQEIWLHTSLQNDVRSEREPRCVAPGSAPRQHEGWGTISASVQGSVKQTIARRQKPTHLYDPERWGKDEKYTRYKATLPIPELKDREWWSVNEQDRMALDLLDCKRGGYFIDLAANHPALRSNSLTMEGKYGWDGLCIESSPKYWSLLMYRTCTVVGAVVGDRTNSTMTFNHAGSIGGFVGEEFANTGVGGKNAYTGVEVKEETMSVETLVSLATLLPKFNAPRTIDFFSLDVEGGEALVLHGFPWEDYTISVLAIERPNDAIHNLLRRNGLRLVDTPPNEWGDALYVQESIVARMDDVHKFKTDAWMKRSCTFRE
jgi:hypothetical protein